jgi:hypothetical protein
VTLSVVGLKVSDLDSIMALIFDAGRALRHASERSPVHPASETSFSQFEGPVADAEGWIGQILSDSSEGAYSANSNLTRLQDGSPKWRFRTFEVRSKQSICRR